MPDSGYRVVPGPGIRYLVPGTNLLYLQPHQLSDSLEKKNHILHHRRHPGGNRRLHVLHLAEAGLETRLPAAVL